MPWTFILAYVAKKATNYVVKWLGYQIDKLLEQMVHHSTLRGLSLPQDTSDDRQSEIGDDSPDFTQRLLHQPLHSMRRLLDQG